LGKTSSTESKTSNQVRNFSIIFLVDHNLEGHALLLAGRLTNQGWLDLLPIRFALLE
jgi:hypothetical protein